MGAANIPQPANTRKSTHPAHRECMHASMEKVPCSAFLWQLCLKAVPMGAKQPLMYSSQKLTAKVAMQLLELTICFVDAVRQKQEGQGLLMHMLSLRLHASCHWFATVVFWKGQIVSAEVPASTCEQTLAFKVNAACTAPAPPAEMVLTNY